MMKVIFSASVTSLATVVAGLCDRFESLSVVDIHWNARGKCTQRGMHCCRGCSSGGAYEWKKENRVCGGVGCIVGMCMK
jgi:hypothetical protein